MATIDQDQDQQPAAGLPTDSALGPTQFRDARVHRCLDVRRGETSRGLIAARDLERYYAAIDRELAALALTEAEAAVIAGARTIDQPRQVDAASIAYRVAASGNARLMGRLAGANHFTRAAVLDAAERYWLVAGTSHAERCRQAGLTT